MYYQICSTDDTGLTLTIFMPSLNLFPNPSALWKIIQPGPNSAYPYPMQSDEWYKTNVLWFFIDIIMKHHVKDEWLLTYYL